MFFKRNGTLNRRRAFTLIELLVVVAIIGLLASIVVINVNNARKKGRDARRLSDLRQSGTIEQDADVVMFLYHKDEEDRENVTLKVAKHRNGPLKMISLRFKGNRISFYGMTKRKG